MYMLVLVLGVVSAQTETDPAAAADPVPAEAPAPAPAEPSPAAPSADPAAATTAAAASPSPAVPHNPYGPRFYGPGIGSVTAVVDPVQIARAKQLLLLDQNLQIVSINIACSIMLVPHSCGSFRFCNSILKLTHSPSQSQIYSSSHAFALVFTHSWSIVTDIHSVIVCT